MARHGEKVRKRKDGRWEGRSKIGNDKNGKTIYKSVYGKTYAEVKKKLKDIENASSPELSKPQKFILFSHVIEEWFSSVKLGLKKSTIHKYEYLISKHILPDLGNIPVSNIEANMVNLFAERKLTRGSLNGEKGLSKSYVRSMMLIISSTLHFGAQEGWCKDISSKIHKPSPGKRNLKILDSREQQCLEKKLVEELSPTTIGILITLKTGLRIGEICALKWEDFDFENNILYVRSTVSRIKNPLGSGTTLIIDTPKTTSSLRGIPFSNDLKSVLFQVKSHSNSRYVVSDKKEFLSPRTFEYRYHKIMKQFQFPEINYHALRHSFATRCIEYGVDVKSLSEILGHANVSITLNTYVHSSMNLKREQMEKLPSLTA